MPLFNYQGRSARGELIKGSVDGMSADAVASQLFNSGITPIDIVEARPETDVLVLLKRHLAQGKAELSDLILFSHQMYTLTKAGVPITQALAGLAESTRKHDFKEVLKDVADSLQSGRDLASSLNRHPRVFNRLIVSIVQVGESSGNLDQAFVQLSKYLETEKDTRDRIKSALRYPVIVMIAIAVAVAIINIFVIPAFAKLFASFKAELPWATKLLIGTSDFFVAYGPYILAALLIGGIGLRAWIKTDEGRYAWDRFKLRIPLLGDILNRATLARFARSFAMAQRAGVPLVQGLTVVANAVDNRYIGDHILAMRNGIERGESMTRTAALSGMFTPMVLQMMGVGEETGALDDMMQQVAEFYEREVDYDIKNLSANIEPVLIVAIGIMVLILALGVFLPMWDLAQAARRGG
ncbi:MAG: type II secretion system F family protein [Gammaproteobacteria bacterium]|nr:MAG: type II secretion system F family protein [Gammaproteobacteria bacterium]